MQHAEDDQWRNIRRASRASSRRSSFSGQQRSKPNSRTQSTVRGSHDDEEAEAHDPMRHRRCDFHWIVKSKNHLLWFSDLLNEISISHFTPVEQSPIFQAQDPEKDERERQRQESETKRNPNLDIRITTHVTEKRKKIATHIYRHLLEAHRTPSHPKSPLTGLINSTAFGRPDLAAILHDHYEDMLELATERKRVAGESLDDGFEEKKRR
ncbi:MAG: hypothetical protein Q9183_006637, partial [Haloplaca sp. 2 TL-2023]